MRGIRAEQAAGRRQIIDGTVTDQPELPMEGGVLGSAESTVVRGIRRR